MTTIIFGVIEILGFSNAEFNKLNFFTCPNDVVGFRINSLHNLQLIIWTEKQREGERFQIIGVIWHHRFTRWQLLDTILGYTSQTEEDFLGRLGELIVLDKYLWSNKIMVGFVSTFKFCLVSYTYAYSQEERAPNLLIRESSNTDHGALWQPVTKTRLHNSLKYCS